MPAPAPPPPPLTPAPPPPAAKTFQELKQELEAATKVLLEIYQVNTSALTNAQGRIHRAKLAGLQRNYVVKRKAYNDAYTKVGRMSGKPTNYNKLNKNGNPVGLSIRQATSQVIAGKFASAGKSVVAGMKGVAQSLISNEARLVKLQENLRIARAQQKPTEQIEKNIKALTEKMNANKAASREKWARRLDAAKSVFASKANRMRKLQGQLNQATRNGKNVSAIKANITKLQAEMNANTKAQAEQNAKKQQEEALRKAIKEALTTLNVKGNSVSNNNRAGYVKALQSYKNFKGRGFEYSLSNRNFGVNRYSTTTGLKRASTGKPTTKTYGSHSEYIADVRKQLRDTSDSKKKRDILDRAILNLGTRLSAVTNNKRALNMIDNYRSLAPSNTAYTANLNRRAERRKAVKKNENKKKNGGWSGGGQQIIFGGAPGAAAPAIVNRGPGVIVPGPGAAPMVMPGAGPSMTGPTITVAPTLKVNIPPAAAQAATQMLPPMERTALNNAGGYRRAASLVQNAGGPESVSRALNALQNSNGNVTKAMEKSGLPRNVFTNVNKLGGPVTARRTLTAVKKVSKKITTKKRPATISPGRPAMVSLGRPVRKARKAKKHVSSACACKLPQANKIKLIVSQLRRKNLERNYLKCLLP